MCRELGAENQKLKRFIDIERRIGAERNIDNLLPLIMTEISRFLKADRSTLFLLDWDRNELWTKFAEGLEVDRIRIELKIGLVGASVLTRQVVNVANAYEDIRFNSAFDKVTGFRTESVSAAPIENNSGKVVGAVELLNNETGRFTKQDEAAIRATAGRLSRSEFAADREENRSLLKNLIKSTRCERGSLFAIDMEKGTLFSDISEGLENINIQLSLNLGIAGLAAVTARDLNIPDAYTDPRFDQRTDEKTGYRTRCVLCVPVKNKKDEVLGVIQVINKENGTFDQSDLTYLKLLSSSVAISIENAILLDEQERQFRRFLEVMAASIDAKDSMTAGHSTRVTEYAIGIAKELGFGKKELELLHVAAMLHDYGKLGIDDNVLKKPGKLTSEEYDTIKQHVSITKSILEKMYFSRKYRTVPMIASCHHERLDGSGYLYGLESGEIPFMSKIISVADVFEALTAKRHYHEALPEDKAFEILENDVGVKFDGNVVNALKRFWEKRDV